MLVRGTSSIEHNTREIISCGEFIVQQIKKGWSIEESLNQAEASYGGVYFRDTCEALRRVLRRQLLEDELKS